MSSIYDSIYIINENLSDNKKYTDHLNQIQEPNFKCDINFKKKKEYTLKCYKIKSSILPSIYYNYKNICFSQIIQNNYCEDLPSEYNNYNSNAMKLKLSDYLPNILVPENIPNENNPWRNFPIIGLITLSDMNIKIINLNCGHHGHHEIIDENFNESNEYKKIIHLLDQEYPDFVTLQNNTNITNLFSHKNDIRNYKVIENNSEILQNCKIIYNSNKYDLIYNKLNNKYMKQLFQLKGNKDFIINIVSIYNNNYNDTMKLIKEEMDNNTENLIIGTDFNLKNTKDMLNDFKQKLHLLKFLKYDIFFNNTANNLDIFTNNYNKTNNYIASNFIFSNCYNEYDDKYFNIFQYRTICMDYETVIYNKFDKTKLYIISSKKYKGEYINLLGEYIWYKDEEVTGNPILKKIGNDLKTDGYLFYNTKISGLWYINYEYNQEGYGYWVSETNTEYLGDDKHSKWYVWDDHKNSFVYVNDIIIEKKEKNKSHFKNIQESIIELDLKNQEIEKSYNDMHSKLNQPYDDTTSDVNLDDNITSFFKKNPINNIDSYKNTFIKGDLLIYIWYNDYFIDHIFKNKEYLKDHYNFNFKEDLFCLTSELYKNKPVYQCFAYRNIKLFNPIDNIWFIGNFKKKKNMIITMFTFIVNVKILYGSLQEKIGIL